MRTYLIELSVTSGFITPWHSDTIFGHLCWVAERHDGFMNFSGAAGLIDLHRGGKPPLILSDAFPAGFLPAPADLKEFFDRRMKGELDTDKYSLLKKVKGIEYVNLDQFHRYQKGELFELGEGDDPIISAFTLHNQINRLTNTTREEGSLFELEERFVRGGKFSIYARIREGFEEDTNRLFELFAAGGFGRKKSSGKGAFKVLDIKEFDDLDGVGQPESYLSLSHFVPAQSDPTEGTYKVMVKYGKMGEEKSCGGNPFKKPLLMIRPGAVFRTHNFRPYYGRMVENIVYFNSEVVQYCFAFAVPLGV
jgi:CRISPR-associated protein Csm4